MSNRVLQISGPCLAFTLVLLLAAPARAQYTQTVLYSFCPAGGNCTEGAQPSAGLIADAQGNLYGTTPSGGANGIGTVFELSPPSGGVGAWTEMVLYSFCAQSNCSDGVAPYWGLTFDSKGNLYGTTSYGGGSGVFGTVFELSPPAGGIGPWTYTVLYAFSGGQDGGDPLGGVIFDAAQKNIYGPASVGGASGNGTVFELSPPSGGSGPWTESTLYTFQATNDGTQPQAGLTLDSLGNLYGTTYTGDGPAQGGIVFELSPTGVGSGPWTETILLSNSYQVSGSPGSLNAGLIFDAQGNLYSASQGGGSICCGAVFELSPPGSGAAWNETTIYSFAQFAPGGSYPGGGLLNDSQGNLYGTTSQGGNTSACTFAGLSLGCGIVYAVSRTGAGSWTENQLYAFSNTDGAYPVGSLVADSHGNLFGVTSQGGAYGQGAVYELSPIATSTAVTSNENASTYGQGVYFTATVTPFGATGSVQFQIEGNNFGSPVPLSGGQASSGTIATLAAGGHAIAALYSGTLYYGSSTGSLMQTVDDASTTVNVGLITGSNPSGYGTSLTFTATLMGQYGQVAKRSKGMHPQVVTGSVTWSSNTGCGATPITAGTATCITSVLPGGSDTVTATYGGDDDHNGNNGSVGQTVNQQTPAVKVTNVNPASEGYAAGTPAVVTAILTWTGSGNAPSGTVTFSSTAGGSFVGGASCSPTTTTITCTQTFDPATADVAGTYTISASYPSDENYNSVASTQTNNFSITQTKVTPKVTITTPIPSLEPYGSGFGTILTATLSWTGSGRAPTAGSGKLLSFSSTAAGNFTTVVCLGRASPIVCGTLFTPLAMDAAGAYTMAASYAGDSNYNAASSPQTNNFTITSDTPAVKLTPNPVTIPHASNAPVALTVAFAGAGSSDTAPTGTVTFSAATGTFSGQSCNSSKDVLTCTVNYKPSGTLAPGTYTNYLSASITAVGDFKAASGYANLKVTK